MIWPFKRKKVNEGPRIIEDTHLIFTLNKKGDVSVSVLPRTPESYGDEDDDGAKFSQLVRVLQEGGLDRLIVAAVHESSFAYPIQKKIVHSMKAVIDQEDYIDPRTVFSQS